MQAHFALIILDGDFDLPQHLFTGIADGRTEGGDGLRRIKVKDVQKVLMLKVFAGVQPAAGHEQISGADGRRVSEGRAYVEIIVLLQKGVFKDAEVIPLIIVPMLTDKLCRDFLKLIGKALFPGYAESGLQRAGHGLSVFVLI